MDKRVPRPLRFVPGVMFVLAGVSALAAPPSRIHERLDSGHTFILSGNMHPLAVSSADQGQVETSLVLPRITIHFKMTAAQEADLNRLLAEQQDRSSPQYHKWLTPEQYADRFGLSENDLKKVTEWLQQAGFTNIQVARGRNYISMSGTAANVQYAFQTSIHRYQIRGESHYSNASDPVLPKALDGMVSGIRGLNNIHPRPQLRESLHPRFTSSISGNHFIAPGDFATIYDVQTLYNSGIDGTGQTIVIPGQTDIAMADIEAFQAAAGLPIKDPIVVADPNEADPGTSSDDESESDLDIEWAGAVARGATIIYVSSQDVFDSAIYAINQNLAPVLSLTYGLCEAQTARSTISSMEAALQQANAQGITVIAASGDTGAADCENPNAAVATHGLAVDYPASSAYATGLGGTEFNEGTGTYWSTTNNANGGSALSYIPEQAWNDTVAGALSASGGGVSTLFSKPSWQQGTGVPSDGFRDVPDLALDSSGAVDGVLYCAGGWCTNGFRNSGDFLDVVGGTSVSAPAFAGTVALIDQQNGGPQGNINPILYSLASVSSDAFHDIIVGNNIVPCRIGTLNCSTGALGYTAGTGYDQVTGLGSVDAANLAHEWGSDFQMTVNPTSLSLSSGTSTNVSVQINRFANFTGTVSLACSVAGSLTNTTCSIPASVSGNTGTVNLTIANSGKAAFPSIFPLSGGQKPPIYIVLLLGSGLALFCRRKRVMSGSIAVLSLVLMATACGGGGSSPSQSFTSSPLTGSVTVTATSGVLRRSVPVSVTIPQ